MIIGGGTHMFVCDGYENGYYHFNFGWSGYCDDYFLLSAINPENKDYSKEQTITYSIRKAGEKQTIDGISYELYEDGTALITRGTVEGEYVIPSSIQMNEKTYEVSAISYEAFKDCIGMTTITIPNSITSIGVRAFDGCYSLTSVTIPNSITQISNYAFSGCTSLTSVTIPTSVTRIGYYAFENCSNLTSIDIPNSVTFIGDWAFSGCGSLNTPIYSSTTFTYMPPSYEGDYVIPDGITEIGPSAFANCAKLTSVTIPSSVTSIGGYAFQYCSGLTSLTIPRNVTSIGDYTFYGCGNLISVTIPKNVTSIGRIIFYECNSMRDLYCYAVDIPETDWESFEYLNMGDVTLHVPKGSIDAYNSTEPWNHFADFVALPAEVDIVSGDVTKSGTVDVQDATIVVNYILGTEDNERFDYSVADLNDDGEVDVFDVTLMIASIMSEEHTTKARKVMGIDAPTTAERLMMKRTSEGMTLCIDHAERFTSFQMDVEVPDGVALTGGQLTDNETGHTVCYTKIGENLYRVMALSMSNTPLKTSAGELLELDFSAGGDTQIRNILLVTPQGEAVHFESLSDNVITSIKHIGTSEKKDIYDLSGRKMDVNRQQLPRGFYIVNQKKVVIK